MLQLFLATVSHLQSWPGFTFVGPATARYWACLAECLWWQGLGAVMCLKLFLTQACWQSLLCFPHRTDCHILGPSTERFWHHYLLRLSSWVKWRPLLVYLLCSPFPLHIFYLIIIFSVFASVVIWGPALVLDILSGTIWLETKSCVYSQSVSTGTAPTRLINVQKEDCSPTPDMIKWSGIHHVHSKLEWDMSQTSWSVMTYKNAGRCWQWKPYPLRSTEN